MSFCFDATRPDQCMDYDDKENSHGKMFIEWNESDLWQLILVQRSLICASLYNAEYINIYLATR